MERTPLLQFLKTTLRRLRSKQIDNETAEEKVEEFIGTKSEYGDLYSRAFAWADKNLELDTRISNYPNTLEDVIQTIENKWYEGSGGRRRRATRRRGRGKKKTGRRHTRKY